MAVSVNWITGVISVPRADMTLIQTNPVEIREHNTNEFRIELRDLEDDVGGRPWPRTHDHNADVLVGGISLADVFLILDPYTVTYEDGQYAVYLQGTNNNILEKTNKNQVSVNPNNSAGLVNSAAIEYSSFNGGVTIDVVNGISGTVYNKGTPQNPSGNTADALLIAAYRGFATFYIMGDITLNSGTDFDEMIFVGASKTKSLITIEDNADVINCEFYDGEITGILDGGNVLKNCLIGNINYVNGFIEQCILKTGTIILGGGAEAHFLDCWSGVVGSTTPVIDMGGTGQGLGMRNYNGGVQLKNKTGPEKISIDLNSGQVVLESTVTNGEIVCRGIGKLVDTLGNAILSGTWNGVTIINELINEKLDNLTEYQKNIVFAGDVIIDIVNGTTGTIFPIGTREQPSNNLTDALTICANNKIKRLRLRSDLTIEASHDISEMSIETRGIMGTEVTLEVGCGTNNTAFRYVNLQGTVNNTDVLLVENCSILNLANFTGIMQGVSFAQGSEMSIGTWAEIYNCRAGGEAGNEPEISIGNGLLSIQQYRGNLKFTNKTGSDRTVASFLPGNVSIASTCVAGKIQILGIGEVEKDESGLGCQVDVDAAITNDYIADHVWAHNDAVFLKDMEGGRWVRDGSQMIFYKSDNVTEVVRFDLKKFDGTPATEADEEVAERVRV